MKTVHFLSDLQLAMAPANLGHVAARPQLVLPAKVLVDYDYLPHRGALMGLADRTTEPEQQEALTVIGLVAGQPLHFTAPGVFVTLAEGIDLAPFLAPATALQLELDMLRQARAIAPRGGV